MGFLSFFLGMNSLSTAPSGRMDLPVTYSNLFEGTVFLNDELDERLHGGDLEATAFVKILRWEI